MAAQVTILLFFMPTRYMPGWRLIWGVTLHQFPGNVLVEDFLHGWRPAMTHNHGRNINAIPRADFPRDMDEAPTHDCNMNLSNQNANQDVGSNDLPSGGHFHSGMECRQEIRHCFSPALRVRPHGTGKSSGLVSCHD
jgi:hypothetical protein